MKILDISPYYWEKLVLTLGTTLVVIFGPLIILICQALKVSPIPYLLAAALLSDTGGVATLVGDPPNLMIGSAAHIDFDTFFLHMGGIVFAAWITILFALKYLFRKELAVIPNKYLRKINLTFQENSIL